MKTEYSASDFQAILKDNFAVAIVAVVINPQLLY